MIHVQHLTKMFGEFTAVKDISFEIAAGEMVAFLGSERRGQDDHHQNAHHFVEAHKRSDRN